mgnify:CR=1 FL=1
MEMTLGVEIKDGRMGKSKQKEGAPGEVTGRADRPTMAERRMC